LKKVVVWDAAPCGVVEIYGRFGGTYCVRRQAGYEIQAARTVKTPHAFIPPREHPFALGTLCHYSVCLLWFPLDGDRPVARYLIILDCTDTDEVQTHVHSPSEYRTHDPDIRVTNDNALTGDGRDM